ncbi:hypothetical protein [Haloparvum sedimenti]|uniref:hypothetical protein n=1 Tax=Haloparvum sedimenti TaxID=1678448 RepID=UPI00071E82DE|nr:hypothetical protein [Haloparvum sedimenti]
MEKTDKSHVAETPDEDPRDNPYARHCGQCGDPAVARGEDGGLYCEAHDPDRCREGEIRDDVSTREIVDDWLWEQYGFGVTRLEEEFGDLAPTESGFDTCSSETIVAVEPNEVTAGVHVRRVDVDQEFGDMPFMVELHQKGGVPEKRAQVVALVEADRTHAEVADVLDLTNRSEVATHVNRYRNQDMAQARWLSEHGPDI